MEHLPMWRLNPALPSPQFIKGVVSADYNKDGWPDIFLSCFDGKRVLLKNKGLKIKNSTVYRRYTGSRTGQGGYFYFPDLVLGL